MVELSEKEKQMAKEFLAKKDPNNPFVKAIKKMKKDKEIEIFKDPNLSKQERIILLVDYFLKEYAIITFSDTDEIFIYNEGVYWSHGDKRISKEIQKLIPQFVVTHIVNEVMGQIKRTTYKEREDIKEPIDKLCLKNGILNLTTLEIEPHSPDLIFFNRINVTYDIEKTCPKILKFLKEVVSEVDLVILQEFMGYCLYKRYFIHKALMLVGSGANGKSTLIRLLKEFLGQENCSSIPLQQLENNRFALSTLFGKLSNIFADLPARALRETSIFKMLTGEDLIPAEKKFKDHFFFDNYAKMIFSANQIPRSPDDSDAFFRRWIIINFPNQFLNEKADKNLIRKITTSEELSGFLNFAIKGLKRLISKGDFSNSKTIQQVRETYIRQSDSVGAFIMDCVLISSEDFIPKKEVYTFYCDYCRTKDYPIVPENTFHRQLQTQIRVEDYRPLLEIEDKKQRIQSWRGIKVQLNPDNSDNVDKDDKMESVNKVRDVKEVSYLRKDSNSDLEKIEERYKDV